MSFDLVAWRRKQADLIERRYPPYVGHFNAPQMLRDDADEIMRLRSCIQVMLDQIADVDGTMDAWITGMMTLKGCHVTVVKPMFCKHGFYSATEKCPQC